MPESNNLVVRDQQSLINFDNSFRQLLSHVTEVEFMQMVLPLVPLLPLQSVEFLLLNSTSEELIKIINKVTDEEILNEIAIRTCDDIVAITLTKKDSLSLNSLHVLMDNFNSPLHLELYSKHPSADLIFLRRIKTFISNIDKDWTQVVLTPLENHILKNIGAHAAADDILLGELIDYFESFFISMNNAKQATKKAQEEYKNRKDNPGRWSMERRYFDKTPEGKAEKLACKRVMYYFDMFVAVVSNENIESTRLPYLYETYGRYSVHNITQDIPGLAMQALGYTHANSIGYRILMNPSIDSKYRDKYINAKLDENKGVYESGGSGEEYLNRVATADNPSAVRAIHQAWCKKEDGSTWNFNQASLEKYTRAAALNKNTPSDVIDDLIERICLYCENRSNNEKKDVQYYAEYFIDGQKNGWDYSTDATKAKGILTHSNLSAKSFIRVINALKNMAEGKYADYFEWCIPLMLNPLALNNAITGEAAEIMYDFLITLDDKGNQAMAYLSSCTEASILDYRLAESKIPAVLLNLLERTNNVDIAERFMDHPMRDIVVAARRRFSYLTHQTPLLQMVNNQSPFLIENKEITKEIMTKNDLKPGMRVKLNDGSLGILYFDNDEDDYLTIGFFDGTFMYSSDFNDDLTHNKSQYNIIEIQNDKKVIIWKRNI